MGHTRMLVWEGISEIDGETPIMLLATGVPWRGGKGSKSANPKTGPMIQTWVIRSDMPPSEALNRGMDRAICGTCPHASKASGGTGACYVEGWRVNSIYAAHVTKGSTPMSLEAFAGQEIRFGAYGDPAAVPLHVWEELASVASGTTGYTHQWRNISPEFARIAMASVDSVEEWPQAKARGYRSFVVLPAGSDKPRGAVVCPASDEGGKRVQCITCLQCSGTDSGRRADITIQAHGAGKGSFAALPLEVLA